MGKTRINIPRDRNGDFEPELIEKYQTKSNDLEKQIIAMYVRKRHVRP
jgi:transposase-like protein